MRLRLLALVAVVGFASASHAWNATGHMVVASIAKANLSPTALAEANRLLKFTAMDSSTDFVAVATWADDVRNQRRETGPWHYRDTYFRLDGKPAANKPDADNAVTEIVRFEGILKDKTKPDADRAEALRFLIHIVGDIHQPLHASSLESEAFPKGDKGGNSYQIQSAEGRGTNLHHLWDGGAGLFASTDDDAETAAEAQASTLMKTLPASALSGANDLNVEHWADESTLAAKEFVYTTPIGKVPTPDYLAKGRALAARRVALAGYRLAKLLNTLLGS